MEKIDIGTDINLTDLLVSRMMIQANSGGGKSILARVIMEQSYGKVPFIVIDMDGEYYTLKELLDDVIVIGGHAADIPINLQSARLLPKEIIGNQLSVVLDISEMKMVDRIRYIRLFLESMMELPKEFWVPYFVFIEEAHKFAGEQDKQESGPAIKDLLSRGRKMGFCGIPITQRISKLHKDVAAECNNKFIGRTNLDIDMDRAAKELGFTTSSEYTRLSLRDLKPGHFYAYGTSIEPHHVHEVTIKMPKTRIPKAGSIIDIKAKKPTKKMLSALSKLSQLPAAAQQELKDIAGLQKEVARLKGELSKKSVAASSIPDNNKEVQQARNDMRDHYVPQLRERDGIIATANGEVKKLRAILSKVAQLAGVVMGQELVAVPPPSAKPLPPPPPIPKSTTPPVPRPTALPIVRQSDGGLGKCPKAILSFLAAFEDRTFTKAQISVATGYSTTSSGFQNAMGELNTRGLIIRGARITFNKDRWDDIVSLAGPITEKTYDPHIYSEKLGKCEREVYEVLLTNPGNSFRKEALATETPSGYSPTSSGFQNAVGRLITLELAVREAGEIRLNPELLELL